MGLTEWQKHLFTAGIREQESISFLHGMATMAIHDGVLSDDEIEAFDIWIADNFEFKEVWPISDLIRIIIKFQGGMGDQSTARLEMFNLLSTFATGAEYSTAPDGIFDVSPNIVFKGRTFQFTGTMQYGERDLAMQSVVRLGGAIPKGNGVTLKTDYLVVGDIGSDAWKYKRYGTKIETALTLRAQGKSSIAIVQEKDFIHAITAHQSDIQ